MFGHTLRAVALGSALLSVQVAQAQVTFDGCVDGAGQAVPSRIEAALDTTFATRIEGGRPVILYNPAVLPRLQPTTRLFLYASECARVNLRLPPRVALSASDARRADCWGLAMLMRSNLVEAADIPSIETDLQFSAEEWPRVLGPVRGFDLAACHREEAGRASLAAPEPGQDDWNACARHCGDALLTCQQRVCRGPDCEPCVATYEACVSRCDTRFPR